MNILQRSWARLQQQAATAALISPKGDRAENLERAIQLYNNALQFYTRADYSEDWALITHDLALAYCDRIYGDRAANIEEAIRLLEQVLAARPREVYPERWAITLNSLGNAYMDRLAGDRAENLETARNMLIQSLEVRTRERFPAKWAITQSNLASIYNLRIAGDHAENIEQAIAHSMNALEVVTRETDPQAWAKIQFTLGSSYNRRIKGEQEANKDQAIFHYGQALKVRTRRNLPEKWAMVHSSLVLVYTDRRRGGRIANLDQAILHAQQALQVFTRSAFPEQWARIQNNLANVYSARFRAEATTRAGREDIERVIYHNQQALEVYGRESYPEHWAGTCNNLANAYMDLTLILLSEIVEGPEYYAPDLDTSVFVTGLVDHFLTRHIQLDSIDEEMRTKLAETLEQAIRLAKQALEIFTRESFPEHWARAQFNLANMYTLRVEGNPLENQQEAMSHCQRTLEVYTSDAFPSECRSCANLLGLHCMLLYHWDEAVAAYEEALKAQQLLYRVSLGEESKQIQLKEAGDLAQRQAYVLAHAGQPEKALAVLEAGRARGLAEALQRRDDVLIQVHEQDRQRYREAASRIDLLQAEQRSENPRDYLSIRRDVQAATEQLETIIIEIREYYPDFLADLNYPTLQSTAQELAPLAYLLTTEIGSLILLVPAHGKPDTIWCDGLTKGRLIALLNGLNSTYSYTQGILGGHQLALRRSLRQVLPVFGAELIRPLVDALHALKADAIVLIPCGQLGILPLHAAYYDGKLTLLDSVAVHYTSSAQAIRASLRKAKLLADKKPVLAGVGDPDKTLTYAWPEVASIASLLAAEATHILQQQRATRNALIASLPGGTHLHLACHGAFNLAKPLASALLLANQERLTLQSILDDPALRPIGEMRLAVLSACQSAAIDFQELPDETIGLPAGLLQAGTAGVVGTLWPIADASTAFLMVRFYEHHWNEGHPPAKALHLAQQWLRHATIDDYTALAQRYPALQELDIQLHTRSPESEDAESEKEQPATAQASTEKPPYSHPYFWAGFVFNGA